MTQEIHNSLSYIVTSHVDNIIGQGDQLVVGQIQRGKAYQVANAVW